LACIGYSRKSLWNNARDSQNSGNDDAFVKL